MDELETDKKFSVVKNNPPVDRKNDSEIWQYI